MLSDTQCVFWNYVRIGVRTGRCNECYYCLKNAWLLFCMQRLGVRVFQHMLEFRDGPCREHWEEEELENALSP